MLVSAVLNVSGGVSLDLIKHEDIFEVPHVRVVWPPFCTRLGVAVKAVLMIPAGVLTLQLLYGYELILGELGTNVPLLQVKVCDTQVAGAVTDDVWFTVMVLPEAITLLPSLPLKVHEFGLAQLLVLAV